MFQTPRLDLTVACPVPSTIPRHAARSRRDQNTRRQSSCWNYSGLAAVFCTAALYACASQTSRARMNVANSEETGQETGDTECYTGFPKAISTGRAPTGRHPLRGRAPVEPRHRQYWKTSRLPQSSMCSRFPDFPSAAVACSWLENQCNVPSTPRVFPGTFRHRLTRLWRTQLRRRSQSHRLNRDRLGQLVARWLPVPRFAATHPS